MSVFILDLSAQPGCKTFLCCLIFVSPDDEFRKQDVRHPAKPCDGAVDVHRWELDGIVDAPLPGAQGEGRKCERIASDHEVTMHVVVAVFRFLDGHSGKRDPQYRERDE